MPPPGWYDDPEQPFMWRYWDGAYWTEHRSPQWTPPTRDPKSFSAWFEKSFGCVKVALRRVGLLLVALWGVASVLTFVAGLVLFTSNDGREVRELIGFDDGFGTSNTLTDSQADRAGDLFGDLFVTAIPWIIVVVVVYALITAWSWSIVARVASHHLAESGPGDERIAEFRADAPTTFHTNVQSALPVESAGEVAGASLRRVPAVIGSALMLGLIALGSMVVAAVPIALVAALDLGTAATVLTALFVIGGVIALGAWLWGRLALAPVIAAIGGHGIGVRRSWELTNGRFWYVVGRVVVAALIAGAFGQAVSLLPNFGFFLDFVVLLAIVFVVQTAVSVITTIIQVSTTVVVLDQVDGLDATSGSGRA
jgi:hypothetical protein